ncbi:uncharacterized protein UBRO_20627 [Ustilago bromivora]|uniref:Uncharacterized protein n=1 Tax=Ustilago bromivora TaxID=307758 RepID=A0A1K0GPT7_9BASI|nr:uncharacterized protein UBRO_20627 [Ustilago bromivora]
MVSLSSPGSKKVCTANKSQQSSKSLDRNPASFFVPTQGTFLSIFYYSQTI